MYIFCIYSYRQRYANSYTFLCHFDFMAKHTKNLSFIHSQKIPSNKWSPVSVLFFLSVLLHRKTGTIFNFYFVFKIFAFSFVSLRICFIKSIIFMCMCVLVFIRHDTFTNFCQIWPKKKNFCKLQGDFPSVQL